MTMATIRAERVGSGALIPIRDVSLYVDVIGQGPPLVLMHGGPGADHWTMLPFQRLADRFTLVFYDHRCNGRSVGAPVSSMTWENLTADADALRERLGFETVGGARAIRSEGQVALEYALRYPERLSDLVLMDTGGDSRWAQQHAPGLLAERGFSPRTVRLAERFFDGRTAPWEFLPTLMRLGRRLRPLHELRRGRANDVRGAPDEAAGGGVPLRRQPLDEGLDGDGPAGRDPGPGRWSWPGATTSSSRRSTRRSSRRGSRTLDCGSSSARATIPTTSSPSEVMEAIREFVTQPARGLRGSGGR